MTTPTTRTSRPLPRETVISIVDLVQQFVRGGGTLIGHPDGPVGLQVRVRRDADEETHRLADLLRDRRDELGDHVRAFRPVPLTIDDDLPPPVPMTAVEEVSLDRQLFEESWHLAVSVLVMEHENAVFQIERFLDAKTVAMQRSLDAKVAALADEFEARYERIVLRTIQREVRRCA